MQNAGPGWLSYSPYAPQGQYQQEDEVQSQRAASLMYIRVGSPMKREVEVDISSNYAGGRPIEVPYDQ